LALAQAEAHRAVKAASPKATVGSAYEMAPAYPKTDSDDDRAAAARYHAMNNVFFLEAAMHGHYPKAFVGEPPYELMGFKAGDEKLLYAPLDSMDPMKKKTAAYPAAASSGTAKCSRNWLARSPMELGFVPFMPGPFSTTSNGRRVIPSAMG
jgi:hypothetical protein